MDKAIRWGFLSIIILFSFQARAWTPPVGIPYPPFGVDETHWMYADPARLFDYGSGPQVYRNNSFGPYTHYIDNTHPSATDTSNPFGTPEKPRRTWPYPLPAGAVVQVHGGPYNFVNSSGSKLAIGGTGTQAKPIFFTGTTTNALAMPTISSSEIYFYGDWVVVEKIRFINSCKGSTRPLLKGAPVISMCVRDCVFDGTGVAGNPVCVSTGGSSGNSESMYTLNLVVLRNLMRNYGDWLYASENDSLGVMASQFATNVWVLDNVMYHMGGDGVRLGADIGDAASGANYYVGRNHIYENRENAIDVKQARGAVISENIMHGFDVSSSSSGTAVAVHYLPENVWIINNTIYSSRRGIVSTGVKDLYIIGNRIYDCNDRSLYLDRGGGTFHVLNNTIVNCANGPYTSGTVDALHYRNNIVKDVTGSGYHLYLSSSSIANASTARNFLFHQSGGSVRINWGGSTYTDVLGWISATLKGVGSLAMDPLFQDSGFHIGLLSPARDAGVLLADADYDQKFRASFGVSIMRDMDGDARPSGLAFDIGADEFGEGISNPATNTAPVLQPIANQLVDVGQTLTLTASAADADLPAQILTFSLVQGPTGAAIGSSSGVFTWTPSAAQAGTTNAVSVKVADSGSPSLSATQTFFVTVRAPTTTPSFYLTVSSSSQGAIQIDPLGTLTSSGYQYQSGAAVTLTATPKNGASFVNWMVNGVTNLNNPLNLTMDRNFAVSGTFKRGNKPRGTTTLEMELASETTVLNIDTDSTNEIALESTTDFQTWTTVATGQLPERIAVSSGRTNETFRIVVE